MNRLKGRTEGGYSLTAYGPGGLKKDSTSLDAWRKDLAPTVGLRKWYNHDPAKWEEFQLKYLLELKHNPAVMDFQRVTAGDEIVTLLYAARDTHHTHAWYYNAF